MAFLQVLDGRSFGKLYPLTGDCCTLGREDCCDIHDVFEQNPAVSRRHAQIVRSQEQFIAEDLKSRNGTRLNGRRLDRPTALRDGDRLGICDFKFIFHAGAVPTLRANLLIGDSWFVDESADEQIQSSLEVSSSSFSLSAPTAPNAEARYQALLTLLSKMGKSLELGTMLDWLLEALLGIFPQADRGFVGLQTEGGLLAPAAIRRRTPDDKRPVVISRRIVERVVRGKQAILLSDAICETPTDSNNSLADAQIRSIICAPLIDRDEHALGMLQVDSLRGDQRFQQEDLQLLAALTPQAAFAVRVGQLHRQSLKQANTERDLQLAAQVQASLLPAGSPEVEGYEFFAHYRSARHVGGDYYDYVPLADGRLAIVLADVSGKGVAAALVMAELRGQLSHLLAHESQPAKVLERITSSLVRRSAEIRFVTMLLALLDQNTHEAVLLNAGHMAPLVRRAAGAVEAVGEAERGMALGIDAAETYHESRVLLEPGDCLVFYTDGVTDALNSAEQLYGEARLRAALLRASGGAETLGRSVLDDVAGFVGAVDQADDTCLICIGRKLQKSSPTVLLPPDET